MQDGLGLPDILVAILMAASMCGPRGDTVQLCQYSGSRAVTIWRFVSIVIVYQWWRVVADYHGDEKQQQINCQQQVWNKTEYSRPIARAH